MSDDVELKPCPFCGGRPLLQKHRIAEDAMVAFVNCQKCGVQTEHFEDAYAPSAQARDAWNTRAALTASRSSNDEIVEVLAQIVQCDDDANTEYGVLADCTDNDGKAYQSRALWDCLAQARTLLSKVKEAG